MHNKILVKDHPVIVTGHVVVDYVRDGRVLERIEGDNMCFDSSFNAIRN